MLKVLKSMLNVGVMEDFYQDDKGTWHNRMFEDYDEEDYNNFDD